MREKAEIARHVGNGHKPGQRKLYVTVLPGVPAGVTAAVGLLLLILIRELILDVLAGSGETLP